MPKKSALLAHDVLAEADFGSDRQSHTVTAAIQQTGEEVVTCHVAGDTKTKVRSDLPRDATSKPIEHYVVSACRNTAEKAAHDGRNQWIGISFEVRVQQSQRRTREQCHVLEVPEIDLRPRLIRIYRRSVGNG